ncbi:unnamed protein product [Trichogramma brassicae]|uniref:BTB domain-containing protein n=1 Tax=Trichogramma brassicae TaxID=86971 RepID=A0A6H5J681_9HYME|nr:unnamed protein product [Trichogramma brassicae]
MEGQQQFCLRWHNFQNTLLSSLPKLLDGGYLTDVTLSAGGRHVHAHRLILSACSYYFKELFKDMNSLQHPVIVLPGMEYANLCALVTFMYNGEVNIYQEQLPALLAMADALHIRGLADIAGKASRYENNQTLEHPGIHEENSGKSFHHRSSSEKFDLHQHQHHQHHSSASKNDSSNNKDHDDMTQADMLHESSSIAETMSAADFPGVEGLERHMHPDAVHESDSNSNALSEIGNELLPYSLKIKPYYSINAKLNQRERRATSFKLEAAAAAAAAAVSHCHPLILKEELLDNAKTSVLAADPNYKSFIASAVATTAGSVAQQPPPPPPPPPQMPVAAAPAPASTPASSRASGGSCNKTSVTCLICGKQLSNQYNLRVHMETHSNSSYSCVACSHVSRSRDALRKHVSYRHPPVNSQQKRAKYHNTTTTAAAASAATSTSTTAATTTPTTTSKP